MTTSPTLPDPTVRPTITVDEAAMFLGIGRAYRVPGRAGRLTSHGALRTTFARACSWRFDARSASTPPERERRRHRQRRRCDPTTLDHGEDDRCERYMHSTTTRLRRCVAHRGHRAGRGEAPLPRCDLDALPARRRFLIGLGRTEAIARRWLREILHELRDLDADHELPRRGRHECGPIRLRR